jgi:hypothetical protein
VQQVILDYKNIVVTCVCTISKQSDYQFKNNKVLVSSESAIGFKFVLYFSITFLFT